MGTVTCRVLAGGTALLVAVNVNKKKSRKSSQDRPPRVGNTNTEGQYRGTDSKLCF